MTSHWNDQVQRARTGLGLGLGLGHILIYDILNNNYMLKNKEVYIKGV